MLTFLTSHLGLSPQIAREFINRRRRRGQERAFAPKNSGKIFFGQNHVKFGHFVNFFGHIP